MAGAGEQWVEAAVRAKTAARSQAAAKPSAPGFSRNK